MISLSESLLTAAGLFGLGASAAAAASPAAAQPFLGFSSEDAALLADGRTLSPEDDAADDPFFTAVAEALREAGYLDS